MKFKNASHIYVFFMFVLSLADTVVFTTYAIYYVKTLGLNPLQLVLVGTVLEISYFIFEGVTSVWADTYSRRLSVILGVFIVGAAYIFQGLIPLMQPVLEMAVLSFFAALLIGEIIRGLGEALISGTAEAWVTDETSEEAVGRVFLKANQYRLLARILGVTIAVGLAVISLNLPYIAGGGLYLVMALCLLFIMKETKTPVPETETEGHFFKRMAGTFIHGLGVIRGRPVLVILLLTALFEGAASEGFDRLWQAHFLETFTLPEAGNWEPVVWFGIFTIAADLIGFFATMIYNRKFDAARSRIIKTSLFCLTVLQMSGLVWFGLARSFTAAVAAFLMIKLATALARPIFSTWLNRQIESRSRATVISIIGQSDAAGQALVGPAVGAVGTRMSLRAAMVFSSLLLFPAAGLYGYLAKKSSKKAQ